MLFLHWAFVVLAFGGAFTVIAAIATQSNPLGELGLGMIICGFAIAGLASLLTLAV